MPTRERFDLGLVLFHRDLRLVDNQSLSAALQESKKVIPCFILDPAQINPHPFQSINGLQFMAQSLMELESKLRKYGTHLLLRFGDPPTVLRKLTESLENSLEISNIGLFHHRDYTPFAIKRDEKIQKTLAHLSIEVKSFADILLHEPEEIHTKEGKPYQTFTQFYKTALKLPINPPNCNNSRLEKTKFQEIQFQDEWESENAWNRLNSITINPDLLLKGGRKEGLMLLGNLKQLQNYDEIHDIPSQKTSQLSPHLKFGTISIRETFQTIKAQLGENHPLLRQLYWRDFFSHIAYHFPNVFQSAFREKYTKLRWKNNPIQFQAWCDGKTGFPIVDAGMRQLNQTGFMHNRVRMIVSSFLVKDLFIDWHWGEKYFAQHLIDYDPSLNNGNWQWAASTGCDAQPYFRIFNPWRQQERFDPDCLYIKKWIPELKPLDCDIIQHWEKNSVLYRTLSYPAPIINHKLASARIKEIFKNA